jgi:hypothetical protein
MNGVVTVLGVRCECREKEDELDTPDVAPASDWRHSAKRYRNCFSRASCGVLVLFKQCDSCVMHDCCHRVTHVQNQKDRVSSVKFNTTVYQLTDDGATNPATYPRPAMQHGNRLSTYSVTQDQVRLTISVDSCMPGTNFENYVVNNWQ